MTLDCSNTNRDRPGRFHTEVDNPDFQVCYFCLAKDEQVYNEFVSEWIKTAASSKHFLFKIVELKSKTNSDLTFKASEELRNLTKNDTSANRRKKTAFGSGARGRKILPVESNSVSQESDGRPRKRAKPGFLT